MSGNPILEINKGEKPPFPCKRGPLSLGLEEKKERETIDIFGIDISIP